MLTRRQLECAQKSTITRVIWAVWAHCITSSPHLASLSHLAPERARSQQSIFVCHESHSRFITESGNFLFHCIARRRWCISARGVDDVQHVRPRCIVKWNDAVIDQSSHELFIVQRASLVHMASFHIRFQSSSVVDAEHDRSLASDFSDHVYHEKHVWLQQLWSQRFDAILLLSNRF